MNKNTSKIVKVDIGYTKRFNNAMHTQFHRKQYEQVAKVDPTKLNVSPDMLKEWKDCIDVEVELNKEAQASEITKQMVAKDRERDELLNYLFGTIRTARYSPVEAARNAAEKLMAKLKPYFGIQNEINDSETSHIVGLKKDAEKYPAELSALGLTSALAQLVAANEEYERLAANRLDDSLAVKLPISREARRNTEQAFEVICQCIQASYLITTAAPDRKIIVDLVDAMNKISANMRETHNLSQAQKKSAEKKGGGSKKPGGEGSKKPGEDSKKPGEDSKKPGGDPKKPDDGGTKKPEREEDPGEDQA